LIILKAKGTFYAEGEIVLNPLKTIRWKDLSDKNPPQLPNGTSIDLSISFDENDFLSGINGIVWATYDARQAEIIQDTLLAQNINCEVKRISLDPELELKSTFLISITNEKEIKMAIDFIWKSDSGLRLKPDWSYPTGETNKSFEQWLNGQ
jgi:hypothetical protein